MSDPFDPRPDDLEATLDPDPTSPGPGRPRKYPDALAKTHSLVEQVSVERKALEARDRGLTYAEIAIEIGYSEKSAARRVVRRALKRVLDGAGAKEVRAEELRQNDLLKARLWPKIFAVNEEGEETVDYRALDAFLRLSKARRELSGADVNPRTLLRLEGEVDHKHTVDPEVIGVIDEFMQLADALAQAGSGRDLGDGRDEILEAEIVSEQMFPAIAPQTPQLTSGEPGESTNDEERD